MVARQFGSGLLIQVYMHLFMLHHDSRLVTSYMRLSIDLILSLTRTIRLPKR